MDDPHFRLYAVDLDETLSLPAGRMQFMTPTMKCTLHWGENSQELDAYQSVLIPAGMDAIEVSGSGRVLLASA